MACSIMHQLVLWEQVSSCTSLSQQLHYVMPPICLIMFTMLVLTAAVKISLGNLAMMSALNRVSNS